MKRNKTGSELDRWQHNAVAEATRLSLGERDCSRDPWLSVPHSRGVWLCPAV